MKNETPPPEIEHLSSAQLQAELRKRNAAYMKRWRKERGSGILDFAVLMRRSVSFQVSSAAEDAEDITADNLRAIMLAQRGCCGIEGSQFTLPGEDSVARYKAWSKWRDSLPEAARSRTPVLVRAEPALGWTLGNVFFIARFWEPMYAQCANLSEFNARLLRAARQPGVVVPTREHVLEEVAKLGMGRSLRPREESTDGA